MESGQSDAREKKKVKVTAVVVTFFDRPYMVDAGCF